MLLVGALALFASQCKLNPWPVLLTALIPSARFGSRGRKAVVIGLVVVLVLGAIWIWQQADQPNARRLDFNRTGRDIHADRNLALIRAHPLMFLRSLLFTWRQYGGFYIRTFVGQLGWLTIQLPVWLIAAYVALLAIAAGIGSFRLSRTDRLTCFITWLGSTISIFLLMFLLETYQGQMDRMINGHPQEFNGFQGRYLIPIAPVLMLVVSSTRFRLRAAAWPMICIAGVLVANGVALARIHSAFYGPSINGSPSSNPTPLGATKVGIFRNGYSWLLDVDGNRQWHSPPDRTFAYGGVAGDIPITGDWTGDGYTKVGIYRAKSGDFLLDSNGDEAFDAGDAVYKFLQNVGGPLPGDVPVVGDWSGSGTSKIGIVRKGFLWLLDFNGNGIYEPGTDLQYVYGAPGDIPVVGDWTGTGTSKIGVLRGGFLWLLDANGNGKWDGMAGEDFTFAFGAPGDVPVVGDWTGDGVSKVGMYRAGFLWVLDSADPAVTAATGSAPLIVFQVGGIAGGEPVVGKWCYSTPSNRIVCRSGS
jgi:hypothetical protein